jgi:hypothetical protein
VLSVIRQGSHPSFFQSTDGGRGGTEGEQNHRGQTSCLMGWGPRPYDHSNPVAEVCLSGLDSVSPPLSRW